MLHVSNIYWVALMISITPIIIVCVVVIAAVFLGYLNDDEYHIDDD